MPKYHLIDLSNPYPESISLIDSAYNLWESTYSKILKESNETINPDDFWRSKILAVIEQNKKIIGLHLYNAFNLSCNSISKHSYFKHVKNEKIEEIKNHSITTLMSGEFLTVHPDYRNKPNGISWAEVVVGLCHKVLINSPWDGVIGISRVDFKVDKICNNYGANSIDDIDRHDIKCKIVVARKDELLNPKSQKISPNTNALINELWTEKNNSTPWIQDET
ncbi:MAG: hypothetical protein KDD45_09460, partial [Bdellovibrionales bacterium]|nr:hypothetical protein [Bdellovibrionales bacterium]